MADGSVIIEAKLDASPLTTGINKLGSSISSGIGTAITVGVNAMKDLASSVVETGSAFESQMSTVQAISGATGDSFTQLQDLAKELGNSTVWSATEAGEAMEYMAMAGWSVNDMLGDGNLAGMMNLASAAGEDLATTADIVTDGLTAFGMSASDSGHFADVLAATATNANTNVSMMGETFKYAASICGTLGISVEDCSIATGLMANAGIKSSQAGTALKTGLQRLAAPTDAVSAAMEKYNISLQTNADGSVNLLATMENVRDSLSGLSETEQAAALTTIFGKNAMTGWAAICNSSEADFDKLTEAIYNCDGASEEMAATMVDNLEGAMTLLSSATESLQLAFYDTFSDTAKVAVQELTGYVSRLTDAMNEGGIEGFFSELGSIISDALNYIVSLMPEIVNAAAELITSFVTTLAGSADDIMNAGGEIVTVLYNAIMSNGPVILESGLEIITNVAEGLMEGLPTLVGMAAQIITELVSSFVNFIVEAGPEVEQSFFDMLSSIVEIIPDIVALVIPVMSSLIENILISLYNATPEIMQGANDLLSGIAEAIPDVITLVLGALPDLITSICDFIAGNAGTIAEGAVQLLMGVVDAIPEIIEAIIAALPEIITAIVTGLIEAAPQILEAGVTLLMGLIEAIPQVVAELAAAIPELVFSVGSALVENAPAMLESGHELFGQIVEALGQVGSELLAAIPRILSSAGSAILGSAGSILAVLGQAVSSRFDSIKQTVSNGMTAAGQTMSTAWSTIQTGASTAMSTIGSAISSGYSTVSSTVSTAMSTVSSTMSSAWSAIRSGTSSGMSGVVSAVSSGLSTVKSTVMRVASSAAQWGRDIVNNIASGIRSAISSVTSAVSSVASTIKSFLHFSEPDVGPLSDFHTYMPDMIKMMTSGMMSGRKDVKKAADTLAGDVDDAFDFDYSGYARMVGGFSDDAQRGFSEDSDARKAANGGGMPDQVVELKVDKQTFAKAIAHDVGGYMEWEVL